MLAEGGFRIECLCRTSLHAGPRIFQGYWLNPIATMQGRFVISSRLMTFSNSTVTHCEFVAALFYRGSADLTVSRFHDPTCRTNRRVGATQVEAVPPALCSVLLDHGRLRSSSVELSSCVLCAVLHMSTLYASDLPQYLVVLIL